MGKTEYKVFKTEVILMVKEWDLYEGPLFRDDEVYEDTFFSRKDAVRMAQKKFSKYHLNDYVESVFVKVTALSITEKGTKKLGIVYRKYKGE